MSSRPNGSFRNAARPASHGADHEVVTVRIQRDCPVSVGSEHVGPHLPQTGQDNRLRMTEGISTPRTDDGHGRLQPLEQLTRAR